MVLVSAISKISLLCPYEDQTANLMFSWDTQIHAATPFTLFLVASPSSEGQPLALPAQTPALFLSFIQPSVGSSCWQHLLLNVLWSADKLKAWKKKNKSMEKCLEQWWLLLKCFGSLSRFSHLPGSFTHQRILCSLAHPCFSSPKLIHLSAVDNFCICSL